MQTALIESAGEMESTSGMMESVKETEQEICIFQGQFEMAELTQEGYTDAVDEWSSGKWFIRSPVSAYIRMTRRENMRDFGTVLK